MAEVKQAGIISATVQNNTVTKEKKLPPLVEMIKSQESNIAKALPASITPERFTRVVLNAINNNPKLQNCTPMSFLGAMMSSAQLGLEPNTPLGQAYLIPYGNNVQFQIGYKGQIDLAHRDGTVIEAHAVYENDEFNFEYGYNSDIKHKPALTNRGNPIAYYAVWRNEKYGAKGFEVMSVEDINKHRDKYSKTANNGPWKTDYDAMAKKTVIKQALKYAPMSAETQTAFSLDETIKSKVEVGRMEDIADEMNWNAIDAETGEVLENA